jgi:secreted trypsin-like serine protease
MDPVVTETCLGFGDGSSNCITTANCPIVGTSLIIGGIQAKPAEFPHMAAIGWYANGGIIFKCGGSLISEKFVLTAAHCLASHSKFVNLT